MVQISPVFFFESACMVSLLFAFSILYSLRKYLVNKNNWDTLLTKVCVQSARVCLKKAFRSLHVPICGRFCLNEGGVAGYGDWMRAKYTAKWGVQAAEMVFQTHSSFSIRKRVCCTRSQSKLRPRSVSAASGWFSSHFVIIINNHAEDDSSLCQLLKRAGKTFLITFSTISLD